MQINFDNAALFVSTVEFDVDFSVVAEPCEIELQWQCCGFGIGKLSEPLRQEVFWIIPYRSVVWPLIVISIYLVFWNPRKRPA